MCPKKILRNTPNFDFPDLDKVRDLTMEAAYAAGQVLRKHFRSKLKIAEKPGAGLVTNADFEAQEKAVGILRKAFPKFGFLTEEARPVPGKCPGRWIIDPLDGTTNFVHGFPMFCVSIAAEWDHQLITGVIYHPVLDDIYVAVKNQGSLLNGKKIHTSKTKSLDNALLTTGFTYQKDILLKNEIALFEKLNSVARALRRPGSAALDLAYTAAGVFDAFWERNLSPWDIAAGILLVEEAGGKVSNFEGKSFQIQCKELLASNQSLHPQLIEEIQASVFTPILSQKRPF